MIFPGDLPIYEDISTCSASINLLQKIDNLKNLFSSWEPPILGESNIDTRMEASITYLEQIHNAVINNSIEDKDLNIMVLCKKVVSELGLPPFAAMPLVANALSSSLVA